MKLGELWATWKTDGIFTRFLKPPWEGESTTALNNLYYLRVLNKTISATLETLSEINPNEYKQEITDIISAYYKDKWQRLWDNYHTEYKLLSNGYSITEHGTDNNSGTNSNTNTITKTGTESNVNSESITTTNTGTEKNTGANSITNNVDDTTTNSANTSNNSAYSIYGFNSTNAVPTDTNSGSAETTGNQSRTSTEEKTENLENTLTLNTENNVAGTANNTLTLDTTTGIAGSGTHSTQSSYEKTIAGNTGTKYPCEVLEKERRLWLTEYFSIVFADIDKILTLPIYERK